MTNIDYNQVRTSRYLSGIRFAQVQEELRRRAHRLNFVRAEILADPAWDILLTAYAFELVQRQPTASELSDRMNVPSTTAMRWLKVLEAEGLLERRVVAADRAEVMVSLTLRGIEAMDGYFAGIPD